MKINAGFVKKGDLVKVWFLEKFEFEASKDGLQWIPDETLRCEVNGELRVNLSSPVSDVNQSPFPIPKNDKTSSH